MDKFGIFNLLNSFFDFYKNSNDKNNQNLSTNSQSNTQTNSQPNGGGFSLANLLNVFSNQNGFDKDKNIFQDEKKQTCERNNNLGQKNQTVFTPKNLPPIQNGMLFTLENHDKFVNKIKNTHANTPTIKM